MEDHKQSIAMQSSPDAETYADALPAEKRGTGPDQYDMHRMGKMQETKVCRPLISLCWTLVPTDNDLAQLPLSYDMGIHNGPHGHMGGPVHGVVLCFAQWWYCRRHLRVHRSICWILPGDLLHGGDRKHGPDDRRPIS
jgi:hypothetical protein